MLGFVLLAAAAVLLTIGADLYTDNARALAVGLRVSAIAIGLLLAGAEPEELATALIASARGQPGIAAGDAIGANVTMLTLVLGALLALQPVAGSRRIRAYALAASGASVLAALTMAGGTVNRPEGACLTLAYGVFVAIVLVRERRHPGDAHGFAVDDARGEGRVAGRAALAFGGLAVVTLGGWLAVTGAERIVTRFDLAASGVGLTLVAFATSAELLALLWAARRHRVSELALSALVGSVVGNATATLGVAALVRPLDTRGVTSAAWLAAGLSVLLLVPGGGSRRRGRILGVLLVASYVVFVALALR